MQTIKHGEFRGTGAAVNVEIGFIPDMVITSNFTDGTVVNIGYPRRRIMVYSGGGTEELKVGMRVKGNTSGALGTLLAVHQDTGTWAGGDSAGWLIIDAETETGTFESETIYHLQSAGTDDATGAATSVAGVDIDTAVAADTGVTAYKGSAASNSLGFTVASGMSTDAKLFTYTAYRDG